MSIKSIIAAMCLLSISCSSQQSEESGGTGGGPGFTIPMGGSGGEAGINSGTTCAQQNVPLQVVPPDILIIQDRSISMNDDSNDQKCNGDCGANSKWSQVTTAIGDVVTATQSTVNWGLFYFGDGASMCGVNANPDVPVAIGSAQQIIASLAASSPNGATPTAATINNAVAYMKTLTDLNPKYLLLATDGEPNCLNDNFNNKDVQGAITAVTNSKNAGYPVFVVGIGNVAVATTTLNSMAQAGGMAQSGTTAYYAVTDTASLEAALNQIVGQVASCTISLKNVPSGNWTIAIWAKDSSGNTVQIPNSTTDGWGYTNNTKSSITLVGSACDNLKDDKYSDLQFVYTCQGQDIISPIQ